MTFGGDGQGEEEDGVKTGANAPVRSTEA